MCRGPSAAFTTCVIPRSTSRDLCWAVALQTTPERIQGMEISLAWSQLCERMFANASLLTQMYRFLYPSHELAKYRTCFAATVSSMQWECHLRISDVEVGPNLVDGSRGASVLQQKAEQTAGGRCLMLWLLLRAHFCIFHPQRRWIIITLLHSAHRLVNSEIIPQNIWSSGMENVRSCCCCPVGFYILCSIWKETRVNSNLIRATRFPSEQRTSVV